ncbi:MMPL family transporter [Thermodesulfobacteriota bacterium]
MSKIFLFIYNLLKSYSKVLLFVVFFAFIAFCFLASQITLEDDITKILPKDESVDKLSYVFEHFKFADKLVVTLSSSDDASSDEFIAYADDLASALNSEYKPSHVKEVTYKISDDVMYGLTDSFYANLPLFLDEDDYKTIEARIEKKSIEEGLNSAYKTLISPASIVAKKFIMRDPIGLTPLVLDKLKSFKFNENFDLLNGYIFTKDHEKLLLFIELSNPSSETTENAAFLEGLDETIARISEKNGGRIYAEYFGGAAIAVGNKSQIMRDVNITVSAAGVIIFIFISLFFKRKSLLFVLFLPVAFGGAMSLAFLYLFKAKISAIALGAGSILLGITVDYSIHICAHYKKTGSVKMVINDMAFPISMSCLTTVSAIMCLQFVKSEGLRDLGLFVALSVFSAAFFCLFILPHILSLIKIEPEELSEGGKRTLFQRISSYEFDSNKWVIRVIIIISVGSLFALGTVGFESDMSKMNYMSDDLKVAEKNLNAITDVSMKTIYLVATGKSMNDALINNEKIISDLNGLKGTGAIKEYTNVSAFMMSDTMQQDRITRWKNFWTAEKKGLLRERIVTASSKLKFKEDAFNQFYDFIDSDFKPLKESDSKKLQDLFLREFVTETDELSMVATVVKLSEEDADEIIGKFSKNKDIVIVDMHHIMQSFLDILRSDYELLINLSLGVVLVILFVSYGSILLGLITFTPIVISWVWTLGLMRLFNLKFTIFNIIIPSFVFGLGIDYSIFIVRGILEEYKDGTRNLPSYKGSILLSAFTTVTGIGVLVFAKHPSLRSIASLSIIGIVSVVVISLTLLPKIMKIVLYDKHGKRVYPLTIYPVLTSCYSYTCFVGGCFLLKFIYAFFLRPLPISIKRKKRMFHWLIMYGCAFIVRGSFVKSKEFNDPGEDFSEPAVIISNHQSFLDILLTLMLNPKIIMLTNDWVWNSVFFGKVVQYADFYPVSSGVEDSLERLKAAVADGYSILAFPEGSRSDSPKLRRFHKGAFYLAEELGLDILPIVLHGTGDSIRKKELLIKNGSLTLKILDRIKLDDKEFGADYSERTKKIKKLFSDEYNAMRREYETPDYFKDALIKNYLFKGPVLEWYLKVKLSMEDNYAQFNALIKQDADILDLGCGFGFISYMLSLLSEERSVTGVDYDENKIKVASNCYLKNDRIDFVCSDILEYPLSKKDAFLLSDSLHYLPEKGQEDLIGRCIDNLNEGGIIIIRDGDSELDKRHGITKFTEFFSTRFGFNKTHADGLFFVSKSRLDAIASGKGFTCRVLDNAKYTSNVFFIIEKG